MTRRTSARRGLLVLGCAAAMLSSTPGAEAKCVRAEVAVHRYGQSQLELLSESQCLVPTPFPEDVVVQKTSTSYVPDAPIPTGTPTGVRTEVYIPL